MQINIIKHFKTFTLAALLAGFSFPQDSQAQTRPYVVMLSMDGFRWDYDDHARTPTLDSLAMVGAKVDALIPSFPSKTFPNHYSIATGLVPDHHGIVLNSFWDPASGRRYTISNRAAVEDGSFYGGEPIWCVAERQGVRSASYFWVGSEAEINGCRPGLWKKYDHDFPYPQRIDSVINWLGLPYNVRPGLILWYLDEPDGIGHSDGPLSPACIAKVEELDSLLGIFFRKARSLPHFDSINFIVLSDHGMCPISPERVVYLNHHIDRSWVADYQGGNPVFVLKAEPGKLDTLFNALSKVENIRAYKSSEVPAYLNYGRNPRALDIVVVADSAWSVMMGPGKGSYSGGTHGYDIRNSDMHAIFYAAGPAFSRNVRVEKMNNTDIYPLICRILGLDCPPCDGNIEHALPLLRDGYRY